MTANQRAMLALLGSEPRRGFDASELARRLGTSTHGAARTAASLVRRGYVDRFVGGVGIQRVHWQIAEAIR
jgi:DNA-binding MarR family transcriptional regulator